MKIHKTERGTYRLSWPQGELEINLIPSNDLLPMSCGPRSQWGGRMIYLHDNVGIVGLKFHGCPAVPRICWDNREHHFWQGFNGGFRPRNTVVGDISIGLSEDSSTVDISFSYVSDFVRTTQSWHFRDPQGTDAYITWDTFFRVQNLNPFALQDYMAFFASYHPQGENYYVDLDGRITACADAFWGYADEDRQRRDQQVCAEFRELTRGWTAGIDKPTRASVFYGKPILMSQEEVWFKDGRHLILVQPDVCLAIVSAMRQARDYMLSPPRHHLSAGESFTARVRHVIGKIGGPEDIERQWVTFLTP